MKTGRANRYLLAIAVISFLLVFLVRPLLDVIFGSVQDENGFTLYYLTRLIIDTVYLESIGKSALIATLVTALCLVLSLPLAWIFARYSFPGKALFTGLLLLPMILPPFVGAIGMKRIFSRTGPLSLLCQQFGIGDGTIDWLGAFPLLGIVILEALHLFPILYLNLVAALANVDPTLEEAARNLGARPSRVFWRVTLPLATPGLFAGVVLVFIWSFTELGTPLVFGVLDVLPVRIFNSVNEIGTNPMGHAQVVFVLVVTAVGFWMSKRLIRRGRNVATLGRMSVSGTLLRLRPLQVMAVYGVLFGVLFLAVLPHLSVLCLALGKRWYMTILPEGATLDYISRAMGSDLTRGALLNSLGLALSATVVDVLLGLGIAWLCVRARLRGANWLDALAMLPLAVPGIVIAFGYMGFFTGFHQWLIEVSGVPASEAHPWYLRIAAYFNPRINPMILLAASYAVRRLPYMLRAAHAGLEQVSSTYEEAAANLGASPLRVVWRITLPLIAANLLAGGVLCFSFSMLEVSDSLILAQSEVFYPITKAIYVLMAELDGGDGVASALGLWAMALLAAGILWAAALMGKRVGQMFRAG